MEKIKKYQCFYIQYGVQNYQWGKIGDDSLVFNMYQNQNKNIKIDQSLPYAELWLGTHKNLPCYVNQINQDRKQIELGDLIKQDENYFLGKHIINKFDTSYGLPFLMKILSVNKALSIQAHPSKEMARKLFKKDPLQYKDDNHKPEMIIALGQFEALNRFCSQSNIVNNLRQFPEVIELIGKQIFQEFQEESNYEKQQILLKKMIQNLLDQDEQDITKVIQKIEKKIIDKENSNSHLSDREKLFIRLNQWYPNDLGVLVSKFLNYTVLQKGDSLILDENQPHAYISGECLECMANGDNVVRLGLTPKKKDKKTIMEMLTFSLEDIKQKKGRLISELKNLDSSVLEYKSGYQEFKVIYITIEDKDKASQILKSEGPLVILPYQNYGKLVQLGINGDQNIQMDIIPGKSIYIVPLTEFYFINQSNATLQIFISGIQDDNFQIVKEKI